jgi:NAD(P)-dependent dehydrogenase (short-subunit alcohol dehydrogenase family)
LDYSLDGKVAVVTGAAGGIGMAYSRALAEAGASVVAADLDVQAVEGVASKLASEGLPVIATGVDISSEDSALAMAATARDAFGGIDILVNNAGLMMQIPRHPLVEMPIEWWERVMKVNVTGALICAQACVPCMIDRGRGKIINQSSAGAFYNWSAYGVSKLALVGLTYGLAKELGKHKINVNAIAPGSMETDAVRSVHPADSPWWGERAQLAALGTTGAPEALCGTLVYLASSASDWVSGQCFNVDGGWIMRL